MNKPDFGNTAGHSANAANVQLSAAEMALVQDAEMILTKNSILGKVVELMAGLAGEYRGLLADSCKLIADREEGKADSYKLIAEIERLGPKISRGENYKGLPYVVLDYPRVFGREDVLAVRTMFWWGHYFSVTLHLKGRYQELFMPVIRERLGMLGAAGWHIGESDEEWRHEVEPGNYRSLAAGQGDAVRSDGETDRLLSGRPFLKLSATCPLDKWEDAAVILQGQYRMLLGLVAGSL